MTRRRAECCCLAIALAGWVSLAEAQSGGLVPRVSLMQSWTDNLRLDDRNKDAALITMLSPGISIVSNSGAVRGSLDYSLNGIMYSATDQPSRVTNSLAATGRAELLPGALFVDARAVIGQQDASAFGQQSTPTASLQGGVSNLANANQHETGTLSVSPQLRGTLGSLATYDLRSDFTRTEARGTSLGDSRGRVSSLNVAQRNVSLLGWWVAANAQRVASDASTNTSSSLRAGLNYLPDPDWRFSVNVGKERNDYRGDDMRRGSTSGVSADWTPSPRTSVSADWQHHDYGDSHTLKLEHRMSRSVWNYSDTRTTTLGNAGASGGVGTVYDQFYQLFASLEPDPVKRDAFVRAYLRDQGLSPDAPAAIGFLSSGPSRLRSQQLGVALQGVKTSLSANVVRTVTGRLADNLNQGSLASSSRIEQRSFSLIASYQLSASSGLSLIAMRQDTAGDLDSQSTRLTSVTSNLSMKLGMRLGLQLGVRHSRFEGVTPYAENGAYANLTMSF